MAFEFVCAVCGEVHKGMPAFHAPAPVSYYLVPEAERAERCVLGTDDCIIDDDKFFVHGRIEIPIHGQSDPFVWGVWVSLSEASYYQWGENFEVEKRAHIGPFFGWLNTQLAPYPDTVALKTRVHLRNDWLRPYIELEPTDHPLAVEQREGMSAARAAEIYAQIMHGEQG